MRHLVGGMMVLLCIAGSAAAQPLIRDPGFEKPKLDAGGYATPAVGTKYGAWQIIGKAGQQALFLSKTYSETYGNGTLVFNSHGGKESMDLTGPGNQVALGVQQTVKTTPGQNYTLSFWIGNADDSYANYPGASSASVLVDGTALQTFTANGNTPNRITWSPFSVSFNATKKKTTIAFVNATVSNDYYCGLDDVSLAPAGKYARR